MRLLPSVLVRRGGWRDESTSIRCKWLAWVSVAQPPVHAPFSKPNSPLPLYRVCDRCTMMENHHHYSNAILHLIFGPYLRSLVTDGHTISSSLRIGPASCDPEDHPYIVRCAHV